MNNWNTKGESDSYLTRTIIYIYLPNFTQITMFSSLIYIYIYIYTASIACSKIIKKNINISRKF